MTLTATAAAAASPPQANNTQSAAAGFDKTSQAHSLSHRQTYEPCHLQ